MASEAQTGVFELDGLPLNLTALEWRVLECLIMRKDTVIERSALAEKVYEGDAGTDSNSLEVIVAQLRRKVGKDMIETERGPAVTSSPRENNDVLKRVPEPTASDRRRRSDRRRDHGGCNRASSLSFTTSCKDRSISGSIRTSTADGNGTIKLAGTADGPPFDRRRRGWYWQIVGPINTLQSQSLDGAGLRPPDISGRPSAPRAAKMGPLREAMVTLAIALGVLGTALVICWAGKLM